MEVECHTCAEIVADETECMTCDGCELSYHLKCVGVTKKERNARSASANLRLYCGECCTDPINVISNNVKQLLQFIHKIDAEIQQQRENQATSDATVSRMAAKLTELDAKFGAINGKLTAHSIAPTCKTPTFASVVKNKPIKPVVVIRPKATQESNKTLSDITEKITQDAVKVCNTKNIQGGGIILSCENAGETMKMKQLVESNFGDNYTVSLPEMKNPRLRIANIDSNINRVDILDVLKANNSNITNISWKLITVIEKNIRRTNSVDIVVEVNGDDFKKLLAIGSSQLPWRECQIQRHLYMKRCFKCCGFSHKSTECKSDQKCGRCAGKHERKNCKSRTQCCVNCKSQNDRFKTQLNVNHHAWSESCPIYKRRMDKLVDSIEYSTRE